MNNHNVAKILLLSAASLATAEACNCWANGSTNEAYCESGNLTIDQCLGEESYGRCHWGPGEDYTCDQQAINWYDQQFPTDYPAEYPVPEDYPTEESYQYTHPKDYDSTFANVTWRPSTIQKVANQQYQFEEGLKTDPDVQTINAAMPEILRKAEEAIKERSGKTIRRSVRAFKAFMDTSTPTKECDYESWINCLVTGQQSEWACQRDSLCEIEGNYRYSSDFGQKEEKAGQAWEKLGNGLVRNI